MLSHKLAPITKMKKIIFILLVIVPLNLYGQTENDSIWLNWIDFNKLSVIEYLNVLPIEVVEEDHIYILTIGKKAEVGWIKRNDIDTLMKMIDCTEPSHCVMQVVSSQLPVNEISTIGGQAMDLIDAYRFEKEYPYKLTSCSRNDEERKREITFWFKELIKME